MNQIQQLAQRANKNEKLILGLMSGTSLDGLDLALCKVQGSGLQTNLQLLNFETVAYEQQFKAQIQSVFARQEVSLQDLCLLNEIVGLKHAALINQVLRGWGVNNKEIDFIASHGQTVYHAPQILHGHKDWPNGTLQIGDGDHIAVHTGIITLSDFRQKHLAAGGEGAPLAVYGDYLLFGQRGHDRILLNIGGISNFTYLAADQDPSKVFSTDIGPGNTLMDQFVQRRMGIPYDDNGSRAARGKVNQSLLDALLSDLFFAAPIPKTTGPELFNLAYLERAQESSGTGHLSGEDVLATLAAFTAKAITQAIAALQLIDVTVFVSGGGLHNAHLLSLIQSALPNVHLADTNQLGIHPDAKEAVLFAVLANETVAGAPIDFGRRKGVPSVCMGKISLPY